MNFEELILTLAEKGKQGDLQAVKIQLEYGYGRPSSVDEMETKEEREKMFGLDFQLSEK